MDLLELDLDVEHLMRTQKALRKSVDDSRRLPGGPRGHTGDQGRRLTQEASNSLSRHI